MKIFYCLCAAALLGTFVSPAKAFRMQVLDPTGSIDGIPDWEIDPPIGPIYLVPFSTSNCLVSPSVPSGTACSLVFNDSGVTIQNLQLVFQAPLLTGGADCDSDTFTAANGGTVDAQFTSASCSYDSTDDTYTLDFFGGTGAPSGSVFEFVTDADPNDLPTNLTAVPNVTPEPASIWMVSSAAAMLGLLLFGRRRSIQGSLL